MLTAISCVCSRALVSYLLWLQTSHRQSMIIIEPYFYIFVFVYDEVTSIIWCRQWSPPRGGLIHAGCRYPQLWGRCMIWTPTFMRVGRGRVELAAGQALGCIRSPRLFSNNFYLVSKGCFFLRKMLGTWYGSVGTWFSLNLGTRC